MLLRSTQDISTTITTSIRPLSSNVGTTWYFCEVLIASLNEDSRVEGLLPSQVALTNMGLGPCSARATNDVNVTNRISANRFIDLTSYFVYCSSREPLGLFFWLFRFSGLVSSATATVCSKLRWIRGSRSVFVAFRLERPSKIATLEH